MSEQEQERWEMELAKKRADAANEYGRDLVRRWRERGIDVPDWTPIGPDAFYQPGYGRAPGGSTLPRAERP